MSACDLSARGCAMIAPSTSPTLRPIGRSVGAAFTPDQEAFFRVLGHNGGAREIVAGTVNGHGTIDLLVWTAQTYGRSDKPHTRTWVEDHQHSRAAREIAKLAPAHGNVYASVGTYAKVENRYKPGKQRYCRDVPLPRQCFMLDDVRDLSALRLPPTMAIETSPGNFQVIYRCDVLLLPRDAAQLGKGAALLAGCDESGADAEQILRIPDTRNTKPKNGPDGWPVRLVFADGPTYNRSALAKAFLPGGLPTQEATPAAACGASGTSGRVVGTGDEPWRDPAWRDELRRDADRYAAAAVPGKMLNADSIPYGLVPKPGEEPSIGYRILVGEVRHTSASGNWDASRDRWHVILGLMWRGYTDGQIAAMTERIAAFGEDVKGTDAIWLDICRCVCLCAAKLGAKRRIRNAQPPTAVGPIPHAPPQPRASRARKDRPGLVGGAAELERRYRAAPMLCDLSQTERAAACGVSLGTIKRLEAKLKTHKRIETEIVTTAKGRALRVRLCTDVDPTPLDHVVGIQCVATLSNTEELHGEHTPPPAAPSSAGAEPTAAGVLSCSAPAPTAPARPTIDDVRRAVAEIPARFEFPDKVTGELLPGRVTLARVCKVLACKSDDVQRLYNRVRREQDRERSKENPIIQAYREAAAAKPAEVVARARSTGSAVASAEKKLADLDRRLASEVLDRQVRDQLKKKRTSLARSASYKRTIAGIWATEETRRAALDEGDVARHAAADAALDEIRASRPTQQRPPAAAPPAAPPAPVLTSLPPSNYRPSRFPTLPDVGAQKELCRRAGDLAKAHYEAQKPAPVTGSAFMQGFDGIEERTARAYTP